MATLEMAMRRVMATGASPASERQRRAAAEAAAEQARQQELREITKRLVDLIFAPVS